MLNKGFVAALIILAAVYSYGEDPPNPTQAEPPKTTTPQVDPEFKPSEEISEDKSVPFPVDI